MLLSPIEMYKTNVWKIRETFKIDLMDIEEFNDVYLRNVSEINLTLYIVSANMHCSFLRSKFHKQQTL